MPSRVNKERIPIYYTEAGMIGLSESHTYGLLCGERRRAVDVPVVDST